MNQATEPLSPVIDFLRQHAPFDQMASSHLEYLAKRLKLVFYACDEVVVGPDDGPPDRFFIIKQGTIRGETGGQSQWELVNGECFPIGALLSRRPVRTVNRAVDDTFCYELDRDAFSHLLQKSPVFHDFCTRRLANLLDSALKSVQAHTAARASEDLSLNTPLSALIRRSAVTCRPETPLQNALELMARERVGSVVVTDPRRAPLGMFTLHDVLSRVALPGIALTTPVAEVMSPQPLSLPPAAPAYEAALLMAQAGFGHICVVGEGRLLGVISERDLFSLQRVGLVSLSRSIAEARSVEALVRSERDVHTLVEQMLAQGASVDQITQIITTLNDSITRRIIELELEKTGTPSVPFTWLAFGSEGRAEQTLKTDQDNGILFQTPQGRSADEVRRELLPFARRVNEALAECGFPLCPDGVMASNPQCCLSLQEWRSRFERWIAQSDPEHLLTSTVYFDFRPLFGDPQPAVELRRQLNEQSARNGRFRHRMVANALRNRPPLGLIRDFRMSSGGQHPYTLDLKVQGLAPFVDAARLYALAHRIDETNTVGRLHAAAAAEVLQPTDVDAWSEAYHYIQLLRMRNHRLQAEEGLPLSNHVDPDRLNELDRRILKEAFRQARKLQSAVAHAQRA